MAHVADQWRSWDDLNRALEWIHEALESLGLVGAPPEYEAFYERSAMRDSDDPDVVGERDYVLGVRERGGATVGEFSWTQRLYRAGA